MNERLWTLPDGSGERLGECVIVDVGRGIGCLVRGDALQDLKTED